MEAVAGWFQIWREHEASYPLCEALRIAGLLGDGDAVAEFRHLSRRIERHPLTERGSAAFLRFALGRALTMLGEVEDACEVLSDSRDVDWALTPDHLRFSRLRWLARALSRGGSLAQAVAIRAESGSAVRRPRGGARRARARADRRRRRGDRGSQGAVLGAAGPPGGWARGAKVAELGLGAGVGLGAGAVRGGPLPVLSGAAQMGVQRERAMRAVRRVLAGMVLLVGLTGVPAGPVWAQPGTRKAALEEATRLNDAVVKLLAGGKYDEAMPLAQRALELREKALGHDHPDVATSLNNLALLLKVKGDYVGAEPLYRRALAIRERALGPDHPSVALSLNGLAGLLQAKGDYVGAEPLYRRALDIYERALGPDHPSVALSLFNLASLLQAKGDYAGAEPLYRRALAIYEKALGPDHPNVAASLNGLAVLLMMKGDYAGAEPLYRRALDIWEKALGPDHPHVASGLNNLAWLFQAKGDYAGAEPLIRRALAIREKSLKPDHPDMADSLNSLAGLFKAKGDYAGAEPLLRRALAIREKALGLDHPDVARSLNNLATLLDDKGDYAGAEPLYRRALATVEKAFGPDHPYVANSLDNLAVLLSEKGDYTGAEPLHRRALAIREKVFGSEHPAVASSLSNLGSLLITKGDYAGAEPLCHRALAIREKVFGSEHPAVARSLLLLSILYWANGSPENALPFRQRAEAIRDGSLSDVLATGSERQKQAFLATLQGETDASVTLHVSELFNNPRAARLALTTLLRRKGRVLDAMTDTLAQLRARGSPEDQAALTRYVTLRSDLATRTLRGPSQGEDVAHHEAALAQLRAAIETLEQDLAIRYTSLAASRRSITLKAVQSALPANAALVEIAAFQPFDPRAKPAERFDAPSYVAYVLHSTGAPKWTDLGSAAPIDALVADVRRLAGSADPAYFEAARRLDEKVMRPIRALLGDTRDIYVSSDGELNLVPFAALVDEHGRYLLATYRITYLTSGRDLLRLQATAAQRPLTPPFVLGNPAYDGAGGAVSGAPTSARRSVQMSDLRFDPLAGTEPEARTVAGVLPQARLLLGADATEAAVKALHGPAIVHLATHGFFLTGEAAAAGTRSARFSALIGDPDAHPRFIPENPLLRSGLALAGANQRRSGSEDGILTALEVANLDLWGTRLVVLSACDTGVGDIQRGEGVYGLRRALVLAGAESQMMSLWKVDDSATRTLMAAYYRRLEAGEGRSEALREVQIEMARQGLHPALWAAFIVGGSEKSLDGKDPPPVREVDVAPLQVHPGCGHGCQVTGSDGGGVAGVVVAALIGALAQRRGARGKRCV